jgi:hypothetical protein
MTTGRAKNHWLRRETAQGLVVLVAWIARALVLYRDRAPESLLALGDMGTLLVALGLLARESVILSIGTLWLAADLLSLVATPLPPDTLTALANRVLALTLGAISMARDGPAPGAWWRAVLAFGVLQQGTRWLSHWRLNLNGAWGVPPRALRHVDTLSRFHALSLLGLALGFALLVQGLALVRARRAPSA